LAREREIFNGFRRVEWGKRSIIRREFAPAGAGAGVVFRREIAFKIRVEMEIRLSENALDTVGYTT
jgi:hypothetical protein